MITVYDIVNAYCGEKNIRFSQMDTGLIGEQVKKHFVNVWVIETKQPSPVPDAGFVECHEPWGKFWVAAYPDIFEGEMRKIIEQYFIDKRKRLEEREAAKVQPKIAPKPAAKKIGSFKPSNRI